MGAGGPISNGTGVLLRRGRDTMSARAQKAARGRGEGRAVHRPSGEVPGAATLPAHPGLPAPEQRGEHSCSLRLPVWGTPLRQPSRPAPECHGRAGKGVTGRKRGEVQPQRRPLLSEAKLCLEARQTLLPLLGPSTRFRTFRAGLKAELCPGRCAGRKLHLAPNRSERGAAI